MVSPDDKKLLRGVYLWIMKNEETEEWEKVALIVVMEPWIVDEIEGYFEIGYHERALWIVADLLAWHYGLPSYLDDDLNGVREIWEKSRLIHIWDYHPEKKEWKISEFAKRLGWEGLGMYVV
jgi:hypothetical protein